MLRARRDFWAMDNNTENAAIGRFGYVSDFDAKRMMARVAFPDKNNLVSD